MKKLFAFVLTLALLSLSLVNVYAALEEPTCEDYEISPYYVYTTSLNSVLAISSTSGTCKSTVLAQSGVTKIVVSQKLQKKVDGTWENVSTWKKTFTASYAVYTNTKSSLSSGTYRTRTVAKVYKGSNCEQAAQNSSTVKIA